LSLTPQEKRTAQEIFAADACIDCGGIHKRACPRVKRKVFLGNGNLVEVEYFKRFDATGVIWPEEAFDPDQDDETAGG
jgi:hypothetical protein